MAWKVPMVMARAARLPRRPSSRARSSPAARLVKVTAVSSEGLAPRSSTSQATRSTRVWVLPVPGPASTATVASSAEAACAGPVQPPVGAAPSSPLRAGFANPAPGRLGRLGSLRAKEAHLPLEVLPLGGAEQLDHTIGPVVPRAAHHLPRPQAADALRHAGPGRGPDVLQRHLPENGELRPQGRQHGLVLGAHLLACGRAPSEAAITSGKGARLSKGLASGRT